MPVWQCFGFLTEYISLPKSYVDDNDYKYPIGRQQFDRWANGQKGYGKYKYETNNRALKRISQSSWEERRPRPPSPQTHPLTLVGLHAQKDRPLYHIQDPDNIDLTSAARADMFVSAQRTDNFVRRLVPHALGYFPFITAWVIIIVRESRSNNTHRLKHL